MASDMVSDYIRGGTQKNIYDKSEVVRVDCPLCGKNKYRHIYTERGALGIVRCCECGLIYVNPRLKEPEKIYWGDAEKYFNEARSIFLGSASHHRDPNYSRDLRLIRKHKAQGNFLDIGTNVGFFLRKARNFGWNLYGIEPSPSLSELARKYFGLNVKTAFLQDAGFGGDFFDIVSMTDVFEHISDPSGLLPEVRRILKPGGILFIKVPNGLFNVLKLNLARMTNKLKQYDVFDSYEHVIHYSDRTLRKMLSQHGFKVIKITIGSPIQPSVWHRYVGHYYQYPSPWFMDAKNYLLRLLFFWVSKVEFVLRLGRVGYFAPNIIAIAVKKA